MTQRRYSLNVRIRRMHETATPVEDFNEPFTIDGDADEQATNVQDEIDTVKHQLRDAKVERASITVWDHTDDEDGVEFDSEDFDEDYDDDDFEVTREEADAALAEVDEDLFVQSQDPYHNHDWKVGRLIEGDNAYLTVAHFSTLAGVKAWADAGCPRDEPERDENNNVVLEQEEYEHDAFDDEDADAA